MSVEENKAIVHRIFEETNKGNLAIIYELVGADYVCHLAGKEGIRGLEGLNQFLTTTRTAFPDFHVTIEDLVAEGDKVAVRLTMTATHKGEYKGIAPTGKRLTVTENIIYRIAGGKLVEEWWEGDALGLMQQLGAIPTPGQGGA